MDFDVLTNLSWREVLLGFVAVLLLYVVAMSLRMWRLKHARTVAEIAEPHLAQAAVAAYAAEQAPLVSASPADAEKDLALEKPAERIERERGFPWNEPPPEIPGQQLIDALERHVYQLRSEVKELRTELRLLGEEMQREISQSRAMQSVSPLYSDAMQMAMQGHDAATVSERCGIARAEAELVVALVRNRNDSN
ncbi:MAG: DUF2802 domain-containing protein [Rhodocyclaceae bacterium]